MRRVQIYWLHFRLNVLQPRNLWLKRFKELLGTSLNAPAWWPLSQIHLADILHVRTPQCHLREHWDGGQFGIDSLQVRDWWSPFRLNRGVLNGTYALGEPPLELTPRMSPSAQARWEIELHRTTGDERWPLWRLYSSSLPPTAPAEEWQSMELKGQLDVEKVVLILDKRTPIPVGNCMTQTISCHSCQFVASRSTSDRERNNETYSYFYLCLDRHRHNALSSSWT